MLGASHLGSWGQTRHKPSLGSVRVPSSAGTGLFLRIPCSKQQARSPLTIKINRQPCPPLSAQHSFPKARRAVVPALPRGLPELSTTHRIRKHARQTIFGGRYTPLSVLIKQFPVVSTEWLQPAQQRTPPNPHIVQDIYKYIFILTGYAGV